MTPIVLVGYLAASLVFATFCTKRMLPLRALAIASNIAFIGYGYLGVSWPILILHAAMLPMNIHRLLQEMSLERVGDTVRRRPQKWGELVGRFPSARIGSLEHSNKSQNDSTRCEALGRPPH